MEKKGLLLAFEGIDGSGKGTQLRLLQTWLGTQGIPVMALVQPSDSLSGRILRRRALRDERLPADIELSLFIRDRREQARRFILPSLGKGFTVLLDRHYLSSVAYQGARGIDPGEILRRNLQVAPEADATFLIDIDPSIALRRIRKTRKTDAFERYEYLASVRALYIEWSEHVRNVIIIDGSTAETDIHTMVRTVVKRLLNIT